MEWIKILVVLAFAFPIGYILRYFTREEMEQGKKYFRALFVLSLVGIIFVPLFNLSLISKKTIIFSLIFISIVSFISWKNGKITSIKTVKSARKVK